MSDPVWQKLGPHRFAIDADTLLWAPAGEISVEQGDQISDNFVRLARRYGYVLILIDGSDSPPLRYEVRRIYADKIHRHSVRLAVGVYGGRPTSRAIAMLTFHAVRLLTKMEIEIRYTATEAEARAFLASQRTRLSGS